jgi:CRISPR-associated protein (TIGR03986 family)
VAQVDKVEAGWLTGGIDSEGRLAMQIEPCEWKHVLIEDMHGSPEFKGKVSARESWITKSLKEKYAALGMVARTSANGAVYDFGPGKTPGYTPAPDDRGRKVVKPVKGGMPGVPVVSDKLPGRGGKKKFEYAFFNKPGAVAVPIDRGIVEDFVRLNSKPSKNRPAPDGSWKELKLTFDAGHPIPVFYVGDLKMQGRDFFFGLTRMLKLPHKYSVGDLLRQQKSHKLDAKLHETGDGKTEIVDYKPDFIENLFGYVVEPKDFFADLGMESPRAFARKGRVAFSFATLKEGKATPSATVRVIQSAPRASFSPFYLKPSKPGQLGCEADYSAENPPRLAGRKRYLPRDTKPDHEGRRKKIADMGERQRQAVMNSSGGRPPSAEIESRLRFLLPATDRPLVFKGEIRLHNVTKAELGAVLFALTHGGNPNKPYRHMLGRARPFGAGQMRLRALDLAVEANDDSKIVQRDQDEKLSADTRTGFCRSDSCASLKPFLHAFVEFMRGRPGLKAFPQLPSILEFLGASEPAYAAGREDRLDYMPLREFNDIRKAVKARKDGQPPARPQAQQDGRLLPAPKVAKPVFWT